MIINNEIEKPDDATLILRRLLNATQERVYKAWTTPDQMKQWLCPDPDMSVISVRIDARVGGKFRLQMQKSDGEYFTAVGEYREVKAPERLVYTWDWETDGGGDEFGEVDGKTSLVTVEFLKKGAQTELVLTHSRFASVPSRDNHSEGWGRIITGFAEFVEKE